MYDIGFYNKKKILITGHTGFKGSWLCKMLINAGANVIGYGLEPPTTPSLFEIAEIEKNIKHIIGDVRNFDKLSKVFEEEKPEIVFHLAAQPIVLEGYKNPKDTYEINVMGTVNLMECVRKSSCVKSVVNITTDKVYLNNEWCYGYRESDVLDGYDPYSNSKSCSELVTHCYVNSFFKDKNVPVSTVRAGNVIGGGDFATNRIVPDCLRAAEKKEKILVRNPYSIRPYQHVLEALTVYLLIAQRQYENYEYADCYNVGPDDNNCMATGRLVELFCEKWKDSIKWESVACANAPHEANFLKLDCNKIKMRFGWKSTWNIEQCIEKVCEFHKAYLNGENVSVEMDCQIKEFLEG